MKYLIAEDLALSRPPEGPAPSYIIPFAEWLVDQGYGLASTRNQVRMTAGFSKWLGVRIDVPVFRELIPLPPRRQFVGVPEQLVDRADYVGWSRRFFGKSPDFSNTYRCAQSYST